MRSIDRPRSRDQIVIHGTTSTKQLAFLNERETQITSLLYIEINIELTDRLVCWLS